MKELLSRDRVMSASSGMLQMLSEFLDINTLFVAFNDQTTNRIIKAFNRSEVLVSEGDLPFIETYCSLVCKPGSSGVLTITNTELDVAASKMNLTAQLGATSFIGAPFCWKMAYL